MMNESREFEVELELKARVTMQDIDDIMCTALDGGITGWCRAAKPVGKRLGEYAHEQIARGGSLMLYDAESSDKWEAKNKATRAGFNFFDSEITDITAEKVVSSDPMSVIERLERWAKGDTCDNCPACDDTVFQAAELLRKAYLDEDGPRTNIVTELCPHCEREVEMFWDTDANGFKAFCPYCGERLMLCDECLHSGTGNCDYSNNTDSCRHNPPIPAAVSHKLWMRLGVTLNITDDEADAIMGEDKNASVDTLLGVLRACRFEPDGDSYIPGESIESYNHAHGTEYDDADVDFNL